MARSCRGLRMGAVDLGGQAQWIIRRLRVSSRLPKCGEHFTENCGGIAPDRGPRRTHHTRVDDPGLPPDVQDPLPPTPRYHLDVDSNLLEDLVSGAEQRAGKETDGG